MVKVSTLVYVLENIEESSNEFIDLDEVLDLESKYLEKLFEKIDLTNMELSPALLDNILQAASMV